LPGLIGAREVLREHPAAAGAQLGALRVVGGEGGPLPEHLEDRPPVPHAHEGALQAEQRRQARDPLEPVQPSGPGFGGGPVQPRVLEGLREVGRAHIGQPGEERPEPVEIARGHPQAAQGREGLAPGLAAGQRGRVEALGDLRGL
ncbi:MAG: hypothetical protein ACK559_31955, partial [bacterium]